MAVTYGELRSALLPSRDKSFTGFHAFAGGGSFEVFHGDEDWCCDANKDAAADDLEQTYTPGWYWWPCWPGCLADDTCSGPFPTAEGAYLDAIGD